jgi:hypothetical protein
MGIVSDQLLSSNLGFAIGNRETVLTQIRPSVTVTATFSASRQNIDAAFEVFTDGREETIDTRFYIDQTKYATLPKKGWVLKDEQGTQFKVQNTQSDYAGIGLRLECSAKSQR